jgi:hypothetical protein
MTLLYQKLFKIPYEDAREAVEYRVKAGKLHDEAERQEDLGNKARLRSFGERLRGC